MHGAPDLAALASSGARAVLVAGIAVAAASWVPAPAATGIFGVLSVLVIHGGAFGLIAILGISIFGDDATRGAVQRLLVRLHLRRAP
jgi:hypothetical protein